LFYLSFIIFFTANQFTSFLPNNVFYSKPLIILNFYQEYEHIYNELNKIYLFVFILANLLLTLGIELLFNFIYPDESIEEKINIDKNNDSDDENV
jgi:hypothetical protein